MAGKVFFFKQKTAYEIVSRDWSSDVCSSDLDATDLARSFEDAGVAAIIYTDINRDGAMQGPNIEDRKSVV